MSDWADDPVARRSDGDEPFIRINEYVHCDGHGATVAQSRHTAGGDLVGPVETGVSTWAELQAHASFPADHTVIESDTLNTAMGDLECRRYTVSNGTTVHSFWFASALPGMPVKVITVRDGRVINTVTVVADTSMP